MIYEDNINNKTLSEVLAEIDDKTLVYLGAQSSFFDIATAGDMKRGEYLDGLSNALYKLAERKVQSAKSNFMKALKNPPPWKRANEGDSDDKSIDKYIESMYQWPKRLKSMKDSIQAAECYFEMFVPLKNRVVKSVYPRMDRTGVCIVVYGNEIGGYWMLSEKESGKKMLEQDETTR